MEERLAKKIAALEPARRRKLEAGLDVLVGGDWMNRRRRRVGGWSVLAVLAVWAGTARADQASVSGTAYTLEDCYQAAVKQSESLASQKELIIQSEERFRQAIGSVLPSVVASGLFTWQNQAASTLSPSQQSTVKFTATQPLFQGLREYAALAETKDMLKSAKLATQWAALQLYADTAQAFNLVLSQEKELADLENEDGLPNNRIKFLQGWLSIGRAQDTDVLSVQSTRPR